MSIFNAKTDVEVLNDYLKSLPNKGHGVLKKWAEMLSISTTLMSQIMNGERQMQPDYAYQFKNYFGWTDLETDYFLILIQIQRAQNHDFKKYLEKKQKAIQTQSEKIIERVNFKRTLNEVEQSIFYSSWLYSVIRLYCSTDKKGKTLNEVKSYFKLSNEEAESKLNFLVDTHLCQFDGTHYLMGIASTHLPQSSPHVNKHHTNWRIKAVQNYDYMKKNDLSYTSPISLSRTDYDKIRELILQLVKQTTDIVAPSPEEMVACLNIDLFEISP